MCSSALLYTTCVLQGSSVLDPLFWFVYKFAFYRSKKINDTGYIEHYIIAYSMGEESIPSCACSV